MDKDLITIFTPTYNRKKLLERCFKSLENQSNTNFIWLIIDDGSTDNTGITVEKWKEENKIKIDYFYIENGGKASAYNFALSKCKTDYFLFLDSDDILTYNAIEVLYSKISNIKNQKKISGIIGNRGDLNGKIIGTPMPNVKYIKGIELYQKYKFTGDTLRLYKTSIIKDYKFPIIKNEKFISENVIFDKIDKTYDMLVIQEVLYLGEYQLTGYSAKIDELRRNNPIGYSYSLKSAAETAVSMRKKINWTILYIIWCKNFKIDSFLEFENKITYIIVYPIAFILNLIKKPQFLFNSIEEKDKNERN